MFDVAIIGAGTAGLTAGIYASRAGKKVAVFEAMSCGGQIINSSAIDNFPALPHISGLEYARRLENQARDLGVEIIFDEVSAISGDFLDFHLTGADGQYQARTVILAGGTVARKLYLPDAERFEGRGISYCATCDGNFFKGKAVAVYGGGDSALHEANYLAGIAEKVWLIYRGKQFRASPALLDSAMNKVQIEFLRESEITGLFGEQSLAEIELNHSKRLPVSALFVAIGREPANRELLPDLERDQNGFIVAGDDCRTKLQGVFVAGDVRTKQLRQLITAGADGAIAGNSVADELNRA